MESARTESGAEEPPGVVTGDCGDHPESITRVEGLYLEEIRGILEDVIERRIGRLFDDLEARLQVRRCDERECRSDERLITETDLAEILSCDPRTVRRLELSRLIPAAVRFGGSKRWRLRTIMDWLAKLEENAA